jgi:hypothetical protein
MEERRIEMGYLTPVDVYLIAEESAVDLSGDERNRIFELSGGHPLALIYLLKQICQVQESEARTQLLEETVPYTGDIDEQYWTHWRRIEDDETLVQTLGLLARVRGAIPLEWFTRWVNRETLRKLQQLFLTYLQKEGENYWVFFHNSFRLFLEERTAEPLIGQTSDQQNLEHHQKLAELYQAAAAPYRWETLYHLYKQVIILLWLRLQIRLGFVNRSKLFDHTSLFGQISDWHLRLRVNAKMSLH